MNITDEELEPVKPREEAKRLAELLSGEARTERIYARIELAFRQVESNFLGIITIIRSMMHDLTECVERLAPGCVDCEEAEHRRMLLVAQAEAYQEETERRVKELENSFTHRLDLLEVDLQQVQGERDACLARVKELKARLAEAGGAENQDHRRSVLMPGEWTCPVCKFDLHKRVLRASDGAVGIDTREVLEECPNGCGPLVGVTWEQGCRQMGKVAEEQAEQRQQAEAKLAATENELAETQARLPERMKHCTIQFIECPKGHGRLTATNWIDGGCLVCRLAAVVALHVAIPATTNCKACGEYGVCPTLRAAEGK